jgi:hypothetical protein
VEVCERRVRITGPASPRHRSPWCRYREAEAANRREPCKPDLSWRSPPTSEWQNRLWDARTAILLADLVDCADGRMVEGRSGACFAAETFQCLRILRDTFGEKLQSDEPPKLGIAQSPRNEV